MRGESGSLDNQNGASGQTAQRSVRVNRDDVARLAGTSAAVVSYVVNHGPRPVAEATRKRVLDAIREIGYRPNGIAQALASGVSGVYGLIVPDISNLFFATLAHALEDSISARGRVLLLGDSAESTVRERELVSTFLRRQIDGILFVGVENHASSDDSVMAAVDAGVPVVMLDRVSGANSVSSVVVDNVAGALAATRHLIGHGYPDIAMISGPSHLSTTIDRERGWKQAMAQAKLSVNPEWLIRAPFSRKGGLAAGRTLLDLVDVPRAVFVANEQQAVGLLVAASERKVTVPDDLAIITFDGTEDSEFTSPALSTVAQPLREIAEAAVDLLARPHSDPRSQVVCDFSLVLRESCGGHAHSSSKEGG